MTEADIKAGHAIYTPFALKIYNLWVLDISNAWIWRCPKTYQLRQFQENITDNHLDIGVGTGFYLKHCHWPERTRLALMDLNPVCLATAKKAMAHLLPSTYLADVHKPIKALVEKFDSISINYLLHCLPGSMLNKEIIFNNTTSMLKSGGVLFGATILADNHLHTKVSQRLADFYNKKSIFSNREDTYSALESVINKYLDDVEINVRGCVALFKGYKK